MTHHRTLGEVPTVPNLCPHLRRKWRRKNSVLLFRDSPHSRQGREGIIAGADLISEWSPVSVLIIEVHQRWIAEDGRLLLKDRS